MLTLTLALTFCLLFFVFDPTAIQVAAIALAGALSVPISQLIKRASGISGGAALIAAGIVSVLLTLAAIFLSGQPITFKDLIAQAGIVFSISQVIFKILVADKKPNGELESNDLR